MSVFILFFCLIGEVAIGQSNRYTKYTPQPYRSTYQSSSSNYDMMYQLATELQERSDRNKQYRANLIDWISKIKQGTDDRVLHTSLEYYYKKLRAMDGGFAKRGDQLDKIKFDIQKDIEDSNARQRVKNEALSARQREQPKILWERGNERFKNRRYKEAITDYISVLELVPDFDAAYLYRGYSYYAIGDQTSALQDLNRFINSDSSSPFAFSTRALVRYQIKDFIGALSDFNKEIELHPSSTAYYHRGLVKSALGDYYGTLQDYTSSIELEPSYSMAYNNRGWAHFEHKEYSKAMTDLNKAIVLDPQNWVAFDSRADTKFAQGDLAGCIKDCQTALSLNPKLANSYFLLGKCYDSQRLTEKACMNWSKAGGLGKVEAYELIRKKCQ